jgi:hypothetical protein
VATLFSGAALRDRQIQVRGTAEVSRAFGPGDLAEQMRNTPMLFFVTIDASVAGEPALRGRFR